MLGINSPQQSNSVNFGRGIKAKEVKQYTKTVQEGFNVLGKELDLILHSASTPSVKKQDTGSGSLLSTTYEKKVLPFLNKHKITGVQMEPDGLRKGTDGSPYVSDTFAKNVLMVPLEKLKSKKYGQILSQKTFDDVVSNNPNKGKPKVDYTYVVPQYNKALKEAYTTFKTKVKQLPNLKGNEAKGIQRLNNSFKAFKKEKGAQLEKNAIYNVLSEVHGNDYWKNWSSDIDKTLYNPKKADAAKAKDRIAEIKKQHADKIDLFMFKQMLVSEARKETKEVNAKHGVQTIADSAVAFSDVDIWANQKLFKKDLNLGCPPDNFSADGQAWGFAVIDPKHMFKKDGSLGEGGKLLFNKYETMFKDNPGGVRIDHVIGLIDPFVYKDSPTSKTAGRLYSSPKNPELKQYAKTTTEEYANIIEKIVMPAAKKAGIKSDKIISEDLGTVTEPTQRVLDKLKLRGIVLTQEATGKVNDKFRGKFAPERKIIMMGSHDNIPLTAYTDKVFSDKKKLKKLSRALAIDNAAPNATIKDINTSTKAIMSDKAKFRAAKIAELFTSPAKKVQIFMTDFIGGTETYNKPGTSGSHNWSLRMPKNFEQAYHKNLQEGKGLNIPEALHTAMKHRGLDKKHPQLSENLNKFAQMLKEKE